MSQCSKAASSSSSSDIDARSSGRSDIPGCSAPGPPFPLDSPCLGRGDVPALVGLDRVRCPFAVPAGVQAGTAERSTRETLGREPHQHPTPAVAGVDGPSRFYVLWRYAYRAAELAAGEAIVFT